ncbi:beta-glucosidase [Motilibacter rhizosphaerae]|uniref:Beta-glucosidase n=1 Tax=Motilibacter rhizosphaerae TaxID=598652 RepID=A0A4Q7NAG4_9ACTN|nr:glycoside hydrolase family 3 C-terminal domain-containing protein [Motilibacter rhizosphaerae]RZS79375.1 beta-glucosidase [Motilibacter rhizosphaerae]
MGRDRKHRSRARAAAGIGVLGLLAAATQAGPASAAAPTVTGNHHVDRLLAKMTLDEKLSMIEGQAETASDRQYQAGYLPGIPRLGTPSLRLADGPPGVVTKQDSPGMTATMGLAATFSTEDAQDNGTVIGRDARAAGQDVVLEPFVNMDRDTSDSRGWNTYGEDPLLTSRVGASVITGIQSQGTMAQVKHFIAYDGGTNASVDPQTLHEIYLAPFDAAVKAGVSSVMCSYNAINSGSHSACGDTETLTGILRNELGFKGFVTSDWGGTHSTTYLNAGLDMEMPGGGNPTGGGGFTSFFAKDALKKALASGTIQESRVTEAVGRILYEYDKFGLLSNHPEKRHQVTTPPVSADLQVIQKTAEDAAVLLKDDGGALPLSGSGSTALIGPGGGQTIATNGTGEKSGGLVQYQTGTYQAMQQALGSSANLSYAVGDDMTGTPVPASALSHDGQPGLLRTPTGGGATSVDTTLDFTTAKGNALPAGSADTWTGTLTVPATGTYWLDIQALGGNASLAVDGASKASLNARYGALHATDGNGPLPTTDGLANGRAQLTLTAGAHTIKVTTTADASTGKPTQVRLAWVTPEQQQADHDAAVAAAKKATTAVVFAWSSGDLSQPLPEGQDQLIDDITAVNPNTVVVLNTSQPVAMPWLSKVKAVLEMWYPGDRGGYATADVLLGKANPGGRLPFTWAASLDQELAHQSSHPERSSTGVGGSSCAGFSGFNTPWLCGLTTYSEGVDIGYRFFAANHETPLYPFGYGLSYSTFQYSGLTTAPAEDGGVDVTLTVSNTGSKAGDTTPQVYLDAPKTQPAGAQFAPRTLAGFTRVTVPAGASRSVTIHVAKRQLQYWSIAGGWTTATGARDLHVSTDATTDVLTGGITVS